jgi:hypothetical protein
MVAYLAGPGGRIVTLGLGARLPPLACS